MSFMCCGSACTNDKDQVKDYYIIPVTVDLDKKELGVKNIIRIVRPEWKPEEITVQAMEGGVRNFVFKCGSLSDQSEKNLVVAKVFGTEAFLVDRDEEILHSRMVGSVGLGPRVLGRFNNGYLTSYVPGVLFKPENSFDISDARQLLKLLVKLHAMDVDVAFRQLNDPEAPTINREPKIFKALYKLWEVCPEQLPNRDKDAKYQHILKHKAGLFKEIRTLEEHVKGQGIPVVFSHGDWRNENFIYNGAKGVLTAIDFEFSGMNYETCDIGYYFTVGNFWQHQDGGSWFPTKEQEKLWVRTYLEEKAEHRGEDPESVSAEEVSKWYAWTMKTYMANLLFYHLTCWVLEISSEAPTDFMLLADTFLNVYNTRKTEILAL